MFGSPSSQSTRRRCLAPTSRRLGQPVSRCRPQRDFYPAVAQRPHLSVVSSIHMLPWRQELIFTWVFETLCKADKSQEKRTFWKAFSLWLCPNPCVTFAHRSLRKVSVASFPAFSNRNDTHLGDLFCSSEAMFLKVIGQVQEGASL